MSQGQPCAAMKWHSAIEYNWDTQRERAPAQECFVHRVHAAGRVLCSSRACEIGGEREHHHGHHADTRNPKAHEQRAALLLEINPCKIGFVCHGGIA